MDINFKASSVCNCIIIFFMITVILYDLLIVHPSVTLETKMSSAVLFKNTWSFDQIRLVLCQFQSKYVGHDVVKLKLLKKIVRNLGKLLQAIWDFLWHTKNMVFFNDPSIYRITINVTCIIGCAQCITMICVKWIFSGKNLSLWSHRHLTPRYFTLAGSIRKMESALPDYF